MSALPRAGTLPTSVLQAMAYDTVETVKVASDETELGYVIINASEFDSKKHKKYVEKKPADGQ